MLEANVANVAVAPEPVMAFGGMSFDRANEIAVGTVRSAGASTLDEKLGSEDVLKLIELWPTVPSISPTKLAALLR